MSPERRLDRLESIAKLMIKAGRRERKETREKINALIDAQMRHEEAYAQSKRITDEAMAELARAQANTQEALAQFARRTGDEMTKLARAQTNTEEHLSALTKNVDRLVNERGNGKA
jgi:putative heme iron utilization protein